MQPSDRQPPGEAAHLPFGARVRTGTQDDPQSFLLCDATKLRGVRLAGPIEFAGMRLVHVPKEIRANQLRIRAAFSSTKPGTQPRDDNLEVVSTQTAK